MSKITKRDYYDVLRHWENNVVASIMGERGDLSNYHTIFNVIIEVDVVWVHGRWSKAGDYCAFCNRLRNRVRTNCRECPIYENTGWTNCSGTPWHNTYIDDPLSNWEEYQYLLTLALSNGMADEYLNEIDWEE